MSDGYPTAAQKEALSLICDHEPMPTARLTALCARLVGRWLDTHGGRGLMAAGPARCSR
ncbi:hypothetical protein [Nonomuraea rubra]|uniref:hypothetical protein n=1 Tax=Nonomuraea rubra TaxID=46180 RepID=UPI0034101993